MAATVSGVPSCHVDNVSGGGTLLIRVSHLRGATPSKGIAAHILLQRRPDVLPVAVPQKGEAQKTPREAMPQESCKHWEITDGREPGSWVEPNPVPAHLCLRASGSQAHNQIDIGDREPPAIAVFTLAGVEKTKGESHTQHTHAKPHNIQYTHSQKHDMQHTKTTHNIHKHAHTVICEPTPWRTKERSNSTPKITDGVPNLPADVARLALDRCGSC